MYVYVYTSKQNSKKLYNLFINMKEGYKL